MERGFKAPFLCCSLQGALDLDGILRKAEGHLFSYCRHRDRDLTGPPRAGKEDFFCQLRSLFF